MLKLLQQIVDILFKTTKQPLESINNLNPMPTPSKEGKMENNQEIDWLNPTCPISRHFTVKEALWLPQWNRLANEEDGLTDDIKTSLIRLFSKLDTVRDYIGKPIIVHVAYRPNEYNKLVKGAKNSAHTLGKAVDWHSNLGTGNQGSDCDKLKELLLPVIEQWGFRMEDNGVEATWVHLDTNPVPENGNRYFKP